MRRHRLLTHILLPLLLGLPPAAAPAQTAALEGPAAPVPAGVPALLDATGTEAPGGLVWVAVGPDGAELPVIALRDDRGAPFGMVRGRLPGRHLALIVALGEPDEPGAPRPRASALAVFDVAGPDPVPDPAPGPVPDPAPGPAPRPLGELAAAARDYLRARPPAYARLLPGVYRAVADRVERGALAPGDPGSVGAIRTTGELGEAIFAAAAPIIPEADAEAAAATDRFAALIRDASAPHAAPDRIVILDPAGYAAALRAVADALEEARRALDP